MRATVRRPRATTPKWLAPAVILVVVAAAVSAGLYFFGGDSHGHLLQAGLDAVSAGRYEEALSWFEQIPPEAALFGEAQKRIAEVNELSAAQRRQRTRKLADNLYVNIQRLKKNYVDGPGPRAANYAANCRYLLKRARDFLDSCPDDARAGEVRGLFSYYTNVASLDRPPTFEDARAEISFRMAAHTWNLAARAIDEYAQEAKDDADRVAQLREEVRLNALNYWKSYRRDRIEAEAMQPGEENWVKVMGRSKRFLDDVSDLPDVGADAQALYDRAAREMGG